MARQVPLRDLDKNLEFEKGLPEGWMFFQWGDYLVLKYGKGLPTKHRSNNGKFPVYGSSGVNSFSDTFLVEKPCLIIGRKGNAGKIHYAIGPSWPIDTTYYLDEFPMYEQKFLYFLLKQMDLSKLDSSTAIPSLRREDAYSLSLILPPLAEQHRIVSKIESIFAQIDAARDRLLEIEGRIRSGPASLQALRSSVLRQAFEGRLVPQDPNDEPAEVLLKKISSNNKINFEKEGLPKGWITTPLKQIAVLINGRAFKPEDWSRQGLPIVRIQNLNDPKKPFNYCSFEVDKKFHVHNGQLLFAWSGTPGTSFGCFIWEGGNAILNQHIFRVEINEEYLNKKYLQHAINQNLDTYIMKAHGGVGLRHITKGKFEEESILLPPLAEQKRIVSKIESIFAKIDARIIHVLFA